MTDAPILETERPHKPRDMKPVIREIATKTGSSIGFLPEWLKLNVGPGRILFDEYINMRLWDPDFCPRKDLKSFIGNWGMVKIWRAANFIPGVQALTSNKIAASAVLGAYGLATPPMPELHAADAISGDGRTSTVEELQSFLLNKLGYPAFGKPLQGLQSLGSISLENADAASGQITLQDGRTVSAAALAQEIHAAYAQSGYVFQPRLVPHETVEAVCGARVATVRVMTLLMEDGPKIFRACWKIPVGANGVDNFWREGNIVAAIDLEDGTVTRAITGTGIDMKPVDAHPDTGAVFADMTVPLWEEICETARKGAAIFSDFGLLGWDIAATADGPVIIEVNDTPDAIMVQIADRKGLLDTQFLAFMKERRRAFQVWKTEQKNIMKREYGRK